MVPRPARTSASPIWYVSRNFGIPGLIVLLLLVGVASAQRTFENHTLRSESLPEISIHISPDLTYFGQLSIKVGDVAEAEEHVFAKTVHGKLRRVFIAHFEHFLPGNDHFFDYPHLRMANLGGQEYLHQTWALADFELFELPEMREFLKSHKIAAEANWLVDRYVRVVDEGRKHEVILFYLEAASENPAGIHYSGPNEPPPPQAPPPQAERKLIDRARHAFQVLDSTSR
jgi:hypothetical protein